MLYLITFKLEHYEPLFFESEPFLKEICLARKSKEIVIVKSENIKKISLFQISNDEFIISVFNSSHLFL